MQDETTNDLPQPDRTVTVLDVSPYDADHTTLQQIFSHSNWKLHITRTCSEAVTLLKKRLIPVVVCERDLPDGSWRDILERTARATNPREVMVSSRLGDERLWSEVLNLGGYNVIAKPFQESEVFRDVSLAWLHWKNRAERIRIAQDKPRAAGGAV